MRQHDLTQDEGRHLTVRLAVQQRIQRMLRRFPAAILCCFKHTQRQAGYSGGGACGMPVIHFGPVGVNDNVEKHNGMEHYKDNFVIFGKRFASKASELMR